LPDAKFTGRIQYEDKSPYAFGKIRAVGKNETYYTVTDANGEFSIDVVGMKGS